jgi:U3 small nucleolar ribonucleoprotein component
MKIILDEIKMDGVLLNNEGKEISRYSYKGILKDGFTFEDLKNDIEKFNTETLGKQDEFETIKGLSEYLSIHNWD